MNKPLFILITTLFFACQPTSDVAESKIKGTWTLTSAKEKNTPRDLSTSTVEMSFSGSGVLEISTLEKGNPRVVKGSYSLNTTATPWQIDIQTEEGSLIFGLLEFTPENLLHIEHNQSLRPRPAAFWSQNFANLVFKKK